MRAEQSFAEQSLKNRVNRCDTNHTVSELWDMTNRIIMGLWDMMIAV